MSGNNIVADTSLLVNFFNGMDLSRRVKKEQLKTWKQATGERKVTK